MKNTILLPTRAALLADLRARIEAAPIDTPKRAVLEDALIEMEGDEQRTAIVVNGGTMIFAAERLA